MLMYHLALVVHKTTKGAMGACDEGTAGCAGKTLLPWPGPRSARTAHGAHPLQAVVPVPSHPGQACAAPTARGSRAACTARTACPPCARCAALAPHPAASPRPPSPAPPAARCQSRTAPRARGPTAKIAGQRRERRWCSAAMAPSGGGAWRGGGAQRCFGQDVGRRWQAQGWVLRTSAGAALRCSPVALAASVRAA